MNFSPKLEWFGWFPIVFPWISHRSPLIFPWEIGQFSADFPVGCPGGCRRGHWRRGLGTHALPRSRVAHGAAAWLPRGLGECRVVVGADRLRCGKKNYGILMLKMMGLNGRWIIMVGGFKHLLFSILYWIILPIECHWLSYFSRWLFHHQPVYDGMKMLETSGNYRISMKKYHWVWWLSCVGKMRTVRFWKSWDWTGGDMNEVSWCISWE